MSDRRKPEKTWLGMAVSPEFEALTTVEILYTALCRAACCETASLLQKNIITSEDRFLLRSSLAIAS
jgi:hypothetical protein